MKKVLCVVLFVFLVTGVSTAGPLDLHNATTINSLLNNIDGDADGTLGEDGVTITIQGGIAVGTGGATFGGPVSIDNTDVRKGLYRLSGTKKQDQVAPAFIDPIVAADWEVYSPPLTEAAETTLSICGGASVKYTCSGTGQKGASRDYGEGTEQDFSGLTLFLRYYIDPSMASSMTYNFSYFVMYADAGTDNKWTLGSIPQAAGWNEISFTPSMGTFAGTMTDWSSVRKILLIHHFSLAGGYIVLDEFSGWTHGRTKGSIIFNFDDGVLSAYTEGIKYLAKYGFPSIFYVSPEMIVETGAARLSTAYGDFCNWGEIWAAQSAGAIIATHAQTGMPLTTKSALREWIIGQKEPFMERGFNIGANYFAIPGGQALWVGATLGEQELQDTLREYFLHIRGTNPWWSNAKMGTTYNGNGNPQPYWQKDNRWGWAYSANNATAQAKIDLAIANKDVASLFFHAFTESTDPTIAQFRAIVDYVKTKVDAGTLEVITYEDMMNQ